MPNRTNNGTGVPLPWEFEIGSAESRAAARAMIERSDQVDLLLIADIGMPAIKAGIDAPEIAGRSYRCRREDGTVVEVVIP